MALGEIASVTPGARSGRTDGQCLHKNHSIPLIIVEFKNEDAGTDAIPVIALASYYDCMIANVGCNSPQVVASDSSPSGPTVTFFGLAYVGSVVYVPLTTSLWCLPVEVGGSDRHQLYITFDAAVALLASIEREAERFGEVSTFPPRIEHPFLPQIDELNSLDDPGSSVKFQITESLQNNLSGHVYKASSSRGDLIIKLTRSYSADLHKFCAQSGFAPELRAFQRLPGGIIAIAMDYLDGDTLASLSFIPPERGDRWINRLNEVVEELHKNGFVHGDLRPPNILCDPKSDRIMLLDFDWGGKAGDACYPHRRLHPQLTEGRDMSSLKITEDDDKQPDALPDNDLPPIEVLFHGFGTFLETWRAAFKPGVKTVNLDMKENVEKFADVMSSVYDDEGARRDKGLRALNDIFSTVLGARQIAPGEIALAIPRSGTQFARTDGQCLHRNHSIPLIIVEFKNEDAGSKAIPVIELASYYSRMVTNVGRNSPQVVARSRLPTLGITVIGPTVTFFGLAYVGSPVYVPLTTGLWCLPVEVGGSDRHQLYIAFDAAVALLANIDREAEKFAEVSAFPPLIEHPFLPQISSLVSLDDPGSSVKFQITKALQNDFSRHVYEASSPSHGRLIIKLAQTYSADLHKFCARSGFAPKLYAVERLPGGIIAVAMQYVVGHTLGSSTFTIPPERRDRWINHLEVVVEKLHKNGFVHGDLRPPNILCNPDSDMVSLLDFDWGGKSGDAYYPHWRLNPQLTEGRNMSSLKITEDDDKHPSRLNARTWPYNDILIRKRDWEVFERDHEAYKDAEQAQAERKEGMAQTFAAGEQDAKREQVMERCNAAIQRFPRIMEVSTHLIIRKWAYDQSVSLSSVVSVDGMVVQ
ncbi:hypothetical protein OG21DRAFT_1524301 [Imleria badia]|nr:hypothetical protein OG21DRAFT_1524301 [Imleria badia]